MSRKFTKFQIKKESTGVITEGNVVKYVNWDNLKFAATVQEDNVTFKVAEFRDGVEKRQDWIMCKNWDGNFIYLSLFKKGFIVMSNEMLVIGDSDTVMINDWHGEKITVKRLIIEEPIAKSISTGTFQNCYVHPFPSDYFLDHDGIGRIFYTQPDYVGNYFEIVKMGDPTTAYFDSQLKYVRCPDSQKTIATVLSVPFTSNRIFYHVKFDDNTVTQTLYYIHYYNATNQQICASLNSNFHDCMSHPGS